MNSPSESDGRRRKHHWESIYAEGGASEVSWFEPAPTFSLAMLDAVGAAPTDAVIDVGAGASRLTAALLERGFTDLTALDIADDGLAAAHHDLGSAAGRVTWITADLLSWSPHRTYDIWHDRAVFHFLTAATARRRYVEVAREALRPHARMIIATFAEDGPQQCSGLPVARYGPALLVDTLNEPGVATFELLDHRREQHRTPWGTLQALTWVALDCAGRRA